MRVLQEVERIQSQARGDEDSFVELKRELPEDYRRAARQLAAICNAARGEEVLWIVGVSEDDGVVHDLPSTDLQDWWPRLVKCFDEVAPEMVHIVVPMQDGKSVIGMFFTTDRAPFVVTTDGNSRVEREIPWREGNRTRSARRQDLIRLLAPISGLPSMELIHATVIVNQTQGFASENSSEFRPAEVSWTLRAGFFVDAEIPTTFPRHRQSAVIKLGSITLQGTARTQFSRGQDTPSAVMYESDAIRVDSPARFNMNFTSSVELDQRDTLSYEFYNADSISFELALVISGNDRRILFSGDCRRVAVAANPPVDYGRQWSLGQWRHTPSSPAS